MQGRRDRQVGTAGEQQLQSAELATVRRVGHGGGPLAVAYVGVGAKLEEELDHLGVAVPGGDEERAAAVDGYGGVEARGGRRACEV